MKHISLPVLMDSFPRTAHYRAPRKAQESILQFVSQHSSALIQGPTGVGKSAVEYAVAQAAAKEFDGTSFIITPNKTILEQISQEFPDLRVALGRNEHPCLYYEDEEKIAPERLAVMKDDSAVPRAHEIPCSFLFDCPHRVNQETGETFEPGATRCPYLQQKFEAKQGGVVLATMSFYLFTHLFTGEFDTKALVIDEVHRLPGVIRNALSYDITDWNLRRLSEALQPVAPAHAKTLRRFLAAMVRISRKRTIGMPTILSTDELERLTAVLEDIDPNDLRSSIKDAIKSGTLDVRADREVMRKLDVLVRDVRRYVTSFRYSMTDEDRKALNYTCAYHRLEKDGDRIQHKLVVKCYYVVPIIRRILPDYRVSFSATIGKPEIFAYESGIQDPFFSVSSEFPADNARIYAPSDTPNLAMNSRDSGDVGKALKWTFRGVKQFASQGIRSLVVVVSNSERDLSLEIARKEGINAISYGNGVTAKDAAIAFRGGEGDCLVGTSANYAEGVDLPKNTAPVIFFLRPGYPNPRDPETQFEEERFGNARWHLWNWRVIQQALQVRGRNIRSRTDVGVTIFISQQFRRFVFGSLPSSLQNIYKGQVTFDEAIADARKFLKAKM